MAIKRRPFSRLLRHAGDTEDVFSTSTPGILTGVHEIEKQKKNGKAKKKKK